MQAGILQYVHLVLENQSKFRTKTPSPGIIPDTMALTPELGDSHNRIPWSPFQRSTQLLKSSEITTCPRILLRPPIPLLATEALRLNVHTSLATFCFQRHSRTLTNFLPCFGPPFLALRATIKQVDLFELRQAYVFLLREIGK